MTFASDQTIYTMRGTTTNQVKNETKRLWQLFSTTIDNIHTFIS